MLQKLLRQFEMVQTEIVDSLYGDKVKKVERLFLAIEVDFQTLMISIRIIFSNSVGVLIQKLEDLM